MSCGSCFMYYRCPDCGKRFKYALELIPAFGDRFDRCPGCGSMGVLEWDGTSISEDRDYPEVEEP